LEDEFSASGIVLPVSRFCEPAPNQRRCRI
jgi:hypothetical protein